MFSAGIDFGICESKRFNMKKRNVKRQRKKEPPSFPPWLKSYHFVLFALVVMLIFGALMKCMSEV